MNIYYLLIMKVCECDLDLKYSECGNKECYKWHIKTGKYTEELTPDPPNVNFVS